jgi:hypothetical protein
MGAQIAIFSTLSREISSNRRSYSFVVRGEAWLADLPRRWRLGLIADQLPTAALDARRITTCEGE